jgi:N-acetylmuramoyl-L-alanine amidase
MAFLGITLGPGKALSQLKVEVRYPTRNAVVTATGDSTFLFGSVSDPAAILTVAGRRVTVDRSGGWLAWIAIPPDSAFSVAISAQAGSRRARITHPLRRTVWTRRQAAWVDRRSMQPTGTAWFPARETVRLTVRAVPGARVQLRLTPDSAINLELDEVATPQTGTGQPSARYFALISGTLNPSDDQLLAEAAAIETVPMLELIKGADTVRTPWPLRINRIADPVWVRLDDDTASTGLTDQMINARASRTGDYIWRLASGTLLRADARIDGDLRVRLSESVAAWLPEAQVARVAAPALQGPIEIAKPVTEDYEGGYRIKLAMARPLPLHAHMDRNQLVVTIYDAVWSSTDSVSPQFTTGVDADGNSVLRFLPPWPIWGWRYRVIDSELVVEVRRPPLVDPARPLAGKLIVVDAGHPPGGSCGPTGYCEPEANLAVAELVRDQLVSAGAKVVMTRRGTEAIELEPRTVIADSLNADLLVSVHHNALPDGINPLVSVGTSTYYQHPPSAALARGIQSRLVRQLGLRNLGAIRGDLALVRSTWYPSVLTEGIFLIVPAQERLARSRAGKLAYATGIVEGITNFFTAAARPGSPTSLIPDITPIPEAHRFE